MNRRAFLQASAISASLTSGRAADMPMPMTTLGKSGLRVSRFTLGGYHMAVQGEDEALRIIRRAVDLGVNFFDNARLYHKGKSEEIYGKAFGGGLRKQVLLMTKAEKYSREAAMQELEESLRVMKTDYLDLWQCHQVSEHKEVDQILAPGGSLEAFVEAKKQGKVRHIGFTGHRDPSIHLRLLAATDEWETIQFPVNLVDPHYLSFIEQVLPAARKKGLGVLAMKSNAMGGITKNKVARIEECLAFTLSQDIGTVVSGVESTSQLEQNTGIVKAFQKLSKQEISVLLHRTRQGPTGTKVESYKKKENAAGGYRPHRDGEAG
jgi:aryl-alcohol dehydrogenase-like predicted oxidoreductase